MNKQAVVRTYPYGKFNDPAGELKRYLDNGYAVVMANAFDICNGYNGQSYNPPIKGMEYIVEKEIKDE